MSANASAQAETLHPGPARRPIAASLPRKRKAEATTAPRPVRRSAALEHVAAVLADIETSTKAANGIAGALVAIYEPQLAELEAHAERQGQRSSGDGDVGSYIGALKNARELQGLVALAEDMCSRLAHAIYLAGRASEIVRSVHRRAAQ